MDRVAMCHRCLRLCARLPTWLSGALCLTSSFYLPMSSYSPALYATANRELSQCVDDWQRNSTHVNIQRLLALLQSVFPCLKQLLDFRHDAHATGGTAAAQPPGALPDLAAKLQSDLDEALHEFEERMRSLREQQAQLQQEIDADAQDTGSQSKQQQQQQRKIVSDVPPVSARALTSSSGRGNASSRPGPPSSVTPPADAELPPFQF